MFEKINRNKRGPLRPRRRAAIWRVALHFHNAFFNIWSLKRYFGFEVSSNISSIFPSGCAGLSSGHLEIEGRPKIFPNSLWYLSVLTSFILEALGHWSTLTHFLLTSSRTRPLEHSQAPIHPNCIRDNWYGIINS